MHDSHDKKLYRDLVFKSEIAAAEGYMDGKITFDVAMLFDVLDTKDEDVLPYRKINKVVKLSNVQLREFIRRMNDVAGESHDTQEVERHIFLTQFLPIYNAVAYLEPSPEDAANLFDEIAKQGTTEAGEIPHRLFQALGIALLE